MLLTAFSYFFVPAAALVSAPILAQALGIDGRGAVAAVTAPLQLAVALFSFGLPQALVHFMASAPRATAAVAGRVTLLQLAFGAIGAGILAIGAPYFAGNQQSLASLILLASCALVPTTLVGVLRGVASGLHMWQLVTVERCLTEGLKLALFVGFMLADLLTVAAAVIITAGAAIASGVVYLALARPLHRLRHPPVQETLPLGSLAGYSARAWVGSLSGLMLTRMSQVLMTPLAGVTQLGLFVVAVNVADVALLANNAVRDVTMASDSARRESRKATQAARVSLLVSTIVGACLVGTMPVWFTTIFGEEFASAIPIAMLLVVANVLGVPGSVAGAVLSARGYPGRRSMSLVIAATLNLLALVVLTPLAGAFGAAISVLLGNIVASNLNILWANRLIGIRVLDFYAIRRADVAALIAYIKGAFKKFGRN